MVTSRYDEIQKVAANMKTEFEKYWNDTYEVMVISTVLDPRFIMKIFGVYISWNSWRWFFTWDWESSWILLQIDERVPIEIYRSHEETRYVDDFSNSFPLSGLVHSGNELDPSLKFDLFVSSTATTTFTPIENPKSELDNYLKEKLLTRTHDFNILSWWKINGIKY